MEEWRLIISLPESGAVNMAVDEAILLAAARGLLHPRSGSINGRSRQLLWVISRAIIRKLMPSAPGNRVWMLSGV